MGEKRAFNFRQDDLTGVENHFHGRLRDRHPFSSPWTGFMSDDAEEWGPENRREFFLGRTVIKLRQLVFRDSFASVTSLGAAPMLPQRPLPPYGG